MPSRLRNGTTCVAVVFALLALVAVPVVASAAAAAAPTPPCTTQANAARPTTSGLAYYLFESDGAVVSCGAAPLYGSKAGIRRSNAVVAGAARAAGAGYWLATSRGDVYAFGAVNTFGSPARLHLRSPIVAFEPTADGGGYWLVTAKGNLFHFGDAKFFGSTARDHTDGAVVALVATPDGNGYWVVNEDGTVHNFGDAEPLGSLTHRRPSVTAAAATPDGRGLFLLTDDGGVHTLGTGAFYGSLVHRRLPRPPASLASSNDGAGYLLASAAGGVYNFGDAPFDGSLASSPPRRPTNIVALSAVTLAVATTTTGATTTGVVTTTSAAPSSMLPHGVFGYDVSNFQCSSPGSSSASASLPTAAPFAVIEVAGWLDNSTNSCLVAEATWATQAAGAAGSHYGLYLFANAPDQSAAATAIDSTGPAGTCSTLAPASQPACIAYNYGYGGATAAFTHSSASGVSSPLWWLDVEGTTLSASEWSNYNAGQFWSSTTSLNDATIQGAIDALRAAGVTVGIYSSSVQFPVIAGSFVPSGAQIPLWIAGAPWTSPPYSESGLVGPPTLAGWCAGTSGYGAQNPSDLFAGGVPWLLQETPGTESSPYGIDPDYAC